MRAIVPEQCTTKPRGPSSLPGEIAAGHGHRAGHLRRHLGPAGGRGGGRHRRSDGQPVERLYDVGVAGLHRLLGTERLRAARVLIVVAGMEGALPSVVAGLVERR